MHISLKIAPKKLILLVLLIVTGLVAAHLALGLIQYQMGYDDFAADGVVVRLFDLDNEGSAATWFSSTALFVCALILASISQYKITKRQAYQFHWALLALIFLGLSIDESVSFHEWVGYQLRTTFQLKEFFFFAWIIPALIFVSFIGLIYLRFLLRLSYQQRILFVLAALIYVGGAAGIELFGGRHYEVYGSRNIEYVFLTALEEGFEMIGITIFMYALLSYPFDKPVFDEEKSVT